MFLHPESKAKPSTDVQDVQLLWSPHPRLFFSCWRTVPGLLILLVAFIFQISDFYQRRMIQSSSSVEQDRSKESVRPESEQELEVWATFPPDAEAPRGPGVSILVLKELC